MHDPTPRTAVFAFSSDLVERITGRFPVLATMYGIGGPQTGWDDLSPEGTGLWVDLLRDAQTRLGSLEITDRWDQLARDVIGDYCATELERVESGDHLFDLNSLASNLQSPTVVLESTVLREDADVEALVERLARMEEQLVGYRARLEQGLGTGRVVARRQVLVGVEQTRRHVAAGSVLDRVVEQGSAVSPHRAEALQRAREQAGQALSSLADWLSSTYLPAAGERDAVGRERYLREARRHLGMELDVDEAVAWGWEEVRRIESRMAELAEQIRPGSTVAQVVAGLRADPAWCDPDVSSFLERMRSLQSEAVEGLHGEVFDVPEPLRAIEVQLAPPGGPFGAYYRMPSEDFGRAGAVCYHLESETGIPWFNEVSTAYHEGFPGHHLQLATLVHKRERLSRLQRTLALNTGHAEGWALYAERLMLERGYFEAPAVELGHLINELARAYRVVVDIGLHLELSIPADVDFHPGVPWSYELAVEAMRDRAMLSGPTAEGNVVRYLGWPGQAITYKLGQRVMLDCREALRKRDGFTLAGFHEAVLEAGSLGLGRLQQHLGLSA